MICLRRVVAFLLALMLSFSAVAIEFTPPRLPANYPGMNTSQDYRDAVADQFIRDAILEGRSITTGDTVVIEFGDGAKQTFNVTRDGLNLSVSPVANSFKPAPAPGYTANNDSWGGFNCGSGYWRQVYNYAEVCTAGECTGEWYVAGYQYVSQC